MAHTKKGSAKELLSQTLIELLNKKSFQKISVNELCETAQISRSTFYANFEDKYQLFSFCLDQKHQELNELINSYDPKEFLTVILDFIQNEHNFFYNAIGSSFDAEIIEIFYHFFDAQLTNLFDHKVSNGYKLPGPVEAVSAFYIGGLNSMILRWIKSNYKIPKEELAACQYELLKDLI